jgi:hypothetical protein
VLTVSYWAQVEVVWAAVMDGRTVPARKSAKTKKIGLGFEKIAFKEISLFPTDLFQKAVMREKILCFSKGLYH